MARRIFFGQKQPSILGTRADHGQEIGRNVYCPDALRFAFASQILIAADSNRDLFEAAVAVLDVKVLSGRKPVFLDPRL
jgi:hypothetical protein